MKICVFSTFSSRINCLHDVTAPNKQAYCDRHGYQFKDLEIDYHKQEETLRILMATLLENDIVMMMGCDTAFSNPDIRIEDRAVLEDTRAVISAEDLGNNPINNDVMIWKNTPDCINLLTYVIDEISMWINHGWLWQNHMTERYLHHLVIKPSRYMNSTFFPWTREGNVVTQIPNLSSWEPGDWVIHSLGFPSPRTRAEVIQWALGKVNGTNEPAQVFWHD